MSLLGDMIAAFESLDQAERYTYLTELSKLFSPSDRWHIGRIINAMEINGCRDFVRSLPMELTIQIFEYIPPYELVSCRLVSKQWNTLLTAEHLCRAVVQRWYPGDAELRQGGNAAERSWKWILENSASRDKAILTAKNSFSLTLQRPYTEHLPIDSSQPNMKLNPMLEDHRSFMDRRIACIDPHSPRFLYIYDLISCDYIVELLATPPRSILKGVYLMKDYVMALTSNSTVAYVWKIETLELQTFRLPNVGIQSFMADGNSFVATFLYMDQAVLYDATVNTFVTIGCGMDEGILEFHVLDEQKKRVTLISRKFASDGQRWRAETYSSTGEVLEYEEAVVPPCYNKHTIRTNKRCGKDLFVVSMDGFDSQPPAPEMDGYKDRSVKGGVCTYALLFDRRTGRFTEQRLRFKQLVKVPSDLYIWEGTVHTMPPEQHVQQGGIVVATHVPMSTGIVDRDYFLPVETKTSMQPEFVDAYYLLPVHTVSLGRMVFRRRGQAGRTDATPVCSCDLRVYKGVRELEEEEKEEAVEMPETPGGGVVGPAMAWF
jgi:hypothetical protein